VGVRIERKVVPILMGVLGTDSRVIWIFMGICFLMSLFRRRRLQRRSGLMEVRKSETRRLWIRRNNLRRQLTHRKQMS
jgi:hypothetical protein